MSVSELSDLLSSQSSSETEFELLQEPLSSRDTRLSVVEDDERTGELCVVLLLVLTRVDCSSLSVSVLTASVSLPLSTCEGEEEQRVEDEMTSGRHLEDCPEMPGDKVPEQTPGFFALLMGSDTCRESFFS